MSDLSILVLPDFEAIVTEFLRGFTDIAAIVDDRVYTVTPANIGTEPFVRVHQFDSTAVVRNMPWLDNPVLQVDAYGGPKATASLLGRTCRAALHDLPGSYPGAVITGATTEGWRYEPDRTFDTARPRYVFTLEMWGHPAVAGS